MKAKRLKRLCEYVSSFDEEDQEFEIIVNPFGEMFILDYYQELDIHKMKYLGCQYDASRHGFRIEEIIK